MKSEVKDNTPVVVKRDPYYPCLKRFGGIGDIILFIAPRTGVIVSNDKLGKLGYSDNTWYEDETTELSEHIQVILSN